jgi:hypothetical protein
MKKQLLNLKNLLLTAIFTWLILAAQSTQAQTVYFSENFDTAFTGSPSAPPGWTQTRIQAVTNTAFEFDWQQNVWLGTAWSTGITTAPTTGAVTGTGVLWINDYDLGGTTLAQTERRIESPSFDLSTSTSPYMRFWYFNSEGPGIALNLRVLISTNGGTTWQTLSNVLNGYDSLTSTWNRISVPIPAKFRTTNVKIGFAIVNRYGSANPFIDAVSVEEFTPTVITSAANGNWNSAATWGGIVPTSSHHVVIAHNVTVGTATGIIARCQDLTINSGVTLNFGTTSANSLHAYGNVTVNGTLSAFNGTLGRIVVVGGNFTIATGGVATFNTGTATQGTTAISTALTSTSSTLVLTNSAPASFTNSGTLSAGTNRINNIIHLGSDTFTYNNTVFVPFTFALRNGAVNPNGFLTIGNAPSATTNNTIQRVNGFFTSAPNFNNTNITSRIMAYQFSNTVSVLPEQLTAGFEIESISGVRNVTGTLVMNTHDNVLVNFPLRIGTATTGAFTLSRGILITTDTIRLTSFLTPPAGTAPSTATPSTTHGSYVVGALRIDMPTSNTTRTFALGVGTQFNQFTPNGNILKNRPIAPGASWSAGTSITMRLLTGATGAVSSPVVSLLGSNVTQVDLNGGPDVPSTTTITFNGINNYTFGGGTNSDNLFGNENQLYLVQSAAMTGPWDSASLVSGTAIPFVNNTNYSRTTNATISPIATNGGYFTLGTEVGPISYNVTTLNRNTAPLTPGTAQSNVQMMRVNIQTTGVIPGINATSFSMSTTGSTNLSNIVNAKVYFTGTDSNFSAINQFGTTFTSPSGRFIISGTRQLLAGNNFFWITYDVPSTASLGDSLAVSCDTIIVAGTPYSIAQPATGFRIYSLPMTYVSSTSSHPFLNPVEKNSDFHVIMRAEVVTSSTGSPIAVNSFDLNTGSTSNPLTNIDSVIVWYTGTNGTYSTPVFFGGAGSVSGAFTVTGNQNLANNSNYFWVTYRLKPGANVGDSVDVDVNGITVNSSLQIPSVTSPAGSRRIRGVYCVSAATSTGDEEIFNVSIATLNNSSTCTTLAPGPGSIIQRYANYTTLPATNVVAGLTYPLNVTINSCGGFYGEKLNAYIDWNQDGDFNDTLETVMDIPYATGVANAVRSQNITVPCFAMAGQTRMRVVYVEDVSAPSCGTYTWGETEDYTLNVISVPPTYTTSTTIQQTGSTSASATNVAILRVPVKVLATACQPGQITQLNFNTAGTTSNADIVSAKLYKTGNSSVFSISNLLGTVTSPSGAFSFSITDTALNDSNNYWLTYDVSGSAPNGNVLDARFDSAQVFGNWYVPAVSAPAGNIVIATPMTYVSSTSSHPTLGKIERGTTGNQMLRIQVVMSSTGAPVALTQLNLSVNGSSSPLTNIDSIMVWYTGGNPNFISPSFYGGTGAQSGAYSISGLQSMLNDTNYFWVNYSVPVGATVGDSVDAEILTINVASTLQTPAVTAPAGSRQIRAPYCASSAGSPAFDGEIWNVTVGTLNNSSTCSTTGGVGSIQGGYANYTTIVAPPNLLAGTQVPFSVHTSTCGGNYTGVLGIWIDFNDDGDFTDAGEEVHMSSTFTYGTTVFRAGNLTIPCVSPGLKRMRVILEETTLTPISPCATYGYGETEDYTVNIVSLPPSYTSSTTLQQSGTTSAGSTNVPILRVPLRVFATSCQPGAITQLNFNTVGTTSAGDIVSAKLYKTGNNAVFSTSNLVGTVTSPSGTFGFSITDTAVNDTNNYWLTYDISGTAPNGNVLDARFDSAQIFGNWYIPAVSTPAGNVLISTPMTFVSTTSNHPTLSKIERGTTNNQILRIGVVMSSTGATVPVTQLNLSVAGSANPTTNIDSISVWYTGANPNFVSPLLFGATGAQSGAYTITGSRNLLNDTNYFWVTYNVPSGATIGDSVDAEIASITIAGIPQTPGITAPSGARLIRAPYCPSVATTTFDGEIWNVTLGTLNNTSSCSNTGGAGSVLNRYSNYSTTVAAPQLAAGAYVPFSVNTSTCGGDYPGVLGIWIDFNDDGDFTDAGEEVHMTPVFTYGTGVFRTGDIVIPLTASPGLKRMRVILIETGTSPITSCQTYSYGETEDYTVEIIPAPIPATYVWNQTVPAAFGTAVNWTPNRTAPNMNDRLVFSSGGTVTVNDLVNHSVKHITVSNNTTVNMNTSASANFNAWDTLALTSGRAITGINVSMSLGNSNAIGTLTGSGSIEGVFARWVDLVSTSYDFPLSHNNVTRNVSIQFNAPVATGGTISASFIPGLPGTTGLPFNDGLINVNRIAENGYWTLGSGNGLSFGTTGNYNLALTANGFNGVVTLSTLTVARRINNTSPWDTAGTYTAATGTNSAPVANRSNLRVLGDFTLGGDSATNPLPVNLVDLKATTIQNDVLVTWITASELNNKGFFVEKSVNGTDFQSIGFVTGKGTTSSLVNYQWLDEKAFAAVNTVYYRLRQVDMDGTEHLSGVVSATRTERSISSATVAPNPFNRTTQLNLVTVEQGEYTITITDIQGKIIATRVMNAVKGLNTINLTEMEQTRAGVYFIRVSGAETTTIKVVKSAN